MTQMRDLSKTQKGRIFSFIAIALMLLFFILTFAWNIRGLTNLFTYTDSCNIDGSDFTPVANLCIAGFNGLLNLFIMLVFVGITWIITLISLLLWRFIAIRQTSVVTELEWKIAKYTWLSFIGISFIGCLAFLQLSHLAFCAFLISLPILLLWLLGVLPLQKNYLKHKETTVQT